SGDLLAVDQERSPTAGTELAAVVCELKANGRLPLRQGPIRGDRVPLQPHPVVAVLDLPALRIQAPTTEPASLAQDDAFDPALRDLDLGGNCVRAVLDVDEDVLHH